MLLGKSLNDHMTKICKLSTQYCTRMAIKWGGTVQGQQLYGAYGTRDILIIVQEDTLQVQQNVVSRQKANLTEEDEKKLDRLGLPPDSRHDEATIMAARIALDSEYTLVATERSKPGEALTKEYILDRISTIMKSTSKDGSKWIASD